MCSTNRQTISCRNRHEVVAYLAGDRRLQGQQYRVNKAAPYIDPEQYMIPIMMRDEYGYEVQSQMHPTLIVQSVLKKWCAEVEHVNGMARF